MDKEPWPGPGWEQVSAKGGNSMVANLPYDDVVLKHEIKRPPLIITH